MNTEQVKRLIRFVTARLNDDERVARSSDEDGGWHLVDERQYGLLVIPTARVLREVEAKRRLLALILAYEARDDAESGCSHTVEEIAAGQCPAAQRVPALLALAAPFADHPDFDPRWADVDR